MNWCYKPKKISRETYDKENYDKEIAQNSMIASEHLRRGSCTVFSYQLQEF